MPILDHFGFIAPFYEKAIPLRDYRRFQELVDMPVGGSLLDVGGGTGRMAQVFNHVAGSIVVADISMGMLRQVYPKPGLIPVCAYSEFLPFSDLAFDRVVMIDALHHVCNQQATADELWRVLKPGGRVVIEEPDIDSFYVKVIAFAEKLALMRSHFLPAARILELFPGSAMQSCIEREKSVAWVVIEK
jgi:demethylmenaquinone methyltransferase/2-methoxy-6-polyprenyl-1,4-benzoquinol methylase